MKTITNLCLIIAVAILLSSCAINHHYTPKPDTHPLDTITQEFTSNKTLSLFNEQKDNSEQLYYENWSGKQRYHANYLTWTDVAIQILNRELTARNATIDESAEESIKLAIVNVSAIADTTTVESQIKLRVNLSNGYSASYSGINSVVFLGWDSKRQIDGALMRAIAAMLSDPKVVDFLRE
ncbi:MAG: hypothetical protein OEU50_07125 [Gammaproteobacteria bacterium]|nr:hypothetical protein [Gammaproteobacteria bacterium]